MTERDMMEEMRAGAIVPEEEPELEESAAGYEEGQDSSEGAASTENHEERPEVEGILELWIPEIPQLSDL